MSEGATTERARTRRLLAGWVLAAAGGSLVFVPLGLALAIAGLVRARAPRTATFGAAALLLAIAATDAILLLAVGISVLAS